MFKLGTITDQVSMDFEKALDYIQKLDMEYIEIHALWDKNIEELSKEEVYEAKRLVAKYGLKVSVISSTLFLQCHLDPSDTAFKPIDDYFITISGSYEEHIRALSHCIELCEIFNTDKIRAFGFIKERGVEDQGAVSKIIDRLSKPVEMVEKAGMTLLLENCPHTYLQFGSLTKEVINQVDSKNFRALWDPANALRSHGVPYPDDYLQIRGLFAHMHAKDISMEGKRHMVPLGEGTIDYRGILAGLVEDGYDGVISLEPEYVDPKGGRPEGLRRSYRGIQTIMQNLSLPAGKG